MKENVIISLADSNYYELLDELVNSIKRFKESENTAICILDAGLSDEQKRQLFQDWSFEKAYRALMEILAQNQIFFWASKKGLDELDQVSLRVNRAIEVFFLMPRTIFERT